MDANYTPEDRVNDAVSPIVAQAIKQIAKRAGVQLAVATKILKRMIAQDHLEQRGQYLRIGNAHEWVEAKEDLPTVDQITTLSFDNSITGYKIESRPPREKSIQEITFSDPKPEISAAQTIFSAPKIRKAARKVATSGDLQKNLFTGSAKKHVNTC